MQFVKINYKKYDDTILKLEYDSKMNIKELKKKIKTIYKIPLYFQKLIIEGIEITDDTKISDCSNGKNIDLYNMNELKVCISLNDEKFYYFFKGADSILNLKQNISKDHNIPVENFQILNSNVFVNDTHFIEDFLLNLILMKEY